MSAETKATEELAKLGQKALDTTEKAGGWLDTVFGEGFRHVGASFADSMDGFRIRNRMRVLEKTQKAIVASGMEGKTRPLDPRIGSPILDAISNESDERLQDVWAAYIRNAVDPQMPDADRLLIEVIRQLEPGDWDVVEKLFRAPPELIGPDKLGIDPKYLEQVMDRLSALGLFTYDDPRAGYITAFEHFKDVLMVQIGQHQYYENKIFRRLVAATAYDSGE